MEKGTKRRGVFEAIPGSGIWWINYYAGGKRHREKAGRKSDAIKLYQKRKADALSGRKLPELRNSKVITVGELIDDALEYIDGHKDRANYESKARIVRADLGAFAASDLTPQDIERWLRDHCKAPATQNRYKAFLSLCYREGERNGKVTANPARLVRGRKEGPGRLRFLSREEYDRLRAVIAHRYPQHLAEFVVSTMTGMRLSEQYSCTWAQVHLDRRTIELVNTKNGAGRIVHLNADALAALQSLNASTGPVFPREGTNYDTRSWFKPALKEASIEGYVWHSNRHTFCSWLAMAGATIKEIQEAAGHKTIAMSARYSHLSPAHNQSVVDRISGEAVLE
jgi:integrase